MSQGDQVIYVDSGGIQPATGSGQARRYVLHVPPGLDPATPVPLLLMLDGRGGTPWTAIKITGWSHKADAERFLVAYPEALKLDPHGPQHFLTNPQMWNAGTGGSDAERTGPDDVQFLRAVIADIRSRHPVDPARIFMAGFSNGASMTFRFALEAPGLLAGIACLSGLFRTHGVPLAAPVPLIYFFGERDTLSPFHGGEVDMPWGGREMRPPALASVEAWVRLLGLPLEPAAVATAGGVTRRTYGPRDDGAEVRFVSIDDLGHVWPGGHRLLPESIAGAESRKVIANDEIWEFFRGKERSEIRSQKSEVRDQSSDGEEKPRIDTNGH